MDTEIKKKKPKLVECLAKALGRLREERLLSQEKLAANAGIARGTVVRALSCGKVNIPNLEKICRALGVTVSSVFKEAELERRNATRE